MGLWVKYLLLWSLASSQFASGATTSICRLVETVYGRTVWMSITHRTYEEHSDLMTAIMAWPLTQKLGLPDYSELNFVLGKQSVLSLGEGDGTFVSRLFDERIARGRTGPATNIFAFDHAYSNPQKSELPQIYDRIVGSGDLRNNYLGGMFQDLDIRFNGKRAQFDWVISSNSLAYVLAESDKAQAKSTLVKALDHVKPGGVMVLWGHFPERGDIDPHGLYRELYAEGLLAGGVIQWSGDFFKPSFIVLHKAQSH